MKMEKTKPKNGKEGFDQSKHNPRIAIRVAAPRHATLGISLARLFNICS